MFTSAFRMSMTASTGVSYETEAATYFAAIATAGSTITTANKAAVNGFIAGCKADGIWTAIKASCLLAGPDSLAGALVPLVGAAPTNNGPFVSGDYSRTTGLLGDGTKYLNANRTSLDDNVDNNHQSVWITSLGDDIKSFLGFGAATATGTSHLFSNTGSFFARNRATNSLSAGVRSTGFLGSSRNNSTSCDVRANGTTSGYSVNSSTPASSSIFVFARSQSGTPGIISNARLSFYSLGESLDLALLNARLTTYMAALT